MKYLCETSKVERRTNEIVFEINREMHLGCANQDNNSTALIASDKFRKIKEIRGMCGRLDDDKVRRRGVVGSAPTYAN